MQKKTKRLLAYVGIIGGCAVLSLTFYTISQYEKAKYQASLTVQLTAKSHVDKATQAQLENEESEAYWWKTVYEDFTKITKQNSAAYVGTAIPAYTLSMLTLVSFGLVLKHADKAKEKEEDSSLASRTLPVASTAT